MEYQNKVNHGFRRREKDGVHFLSIPSFDATGKVRHLFTTRKGGVSKGAYESLNLSKTRENNPENKKENYRRVCAALGCGYEQLALVNYAHGDGIYHAKAEDAGKGIARESDLPDCDAMIVTQPGVTAVTLHADCLPVFFLAPSKEAAGVSHAGWRGVLGRLPAKIAREFIDVYGSDANDLLIGIGPHIGGCCFEVQADVSTLFEQEFGKEVVREEGGKRFVDLQLAVLMQLDEAGIPAANITVSDICTYCETEWFYSHRRDKGNTGAMGSFICLD